MPFDVLTPELALEVLMEASVPLTPGPVRVQARGERWLVRLPNECLAWFAASEQGREILVTERRVLRLLAERCSFSAPRLLFEGRAGDFDVRSKVPGVLDPWDAYALIREDAALAARVGAALGGILAEQHTRIASEDVADWLPRRPSWPEAREWILERLPAVVGEGERELISRADAVMAEYEAVQVSDTDRALVHTDVGLHNLAMDASGVVHGIFDYEDAAWADRHHDFQYLVFDVARDELLDAALSVYEPAVGRRIERSRVLLYNAANALTFLAHRAGTQPDERPCGRTLAEDLRWSALAIERVFGQRSR
jgi:hypothetical protein